MPTASADELKASIRDIPDFPKKGILFRDITPLLYDAAKFRSCIDRFVGMAEGNIDAVVSIESRGFILGSALAYALGAGFVPIRKEGKLPYATYKTSYELEYGSATVEIHSDGLKKGSRVILIDDVLATGGTVKAAVDLVERFGVDVAGVYFLIELSGLRGRDKLASLPVRSLLTY